MIRALRSLVFLCVGLMLGGFSVWSIAQTTGFSTPFQSAGPLSTIAASLCAMQTLGMKPTPQGQACVAEETYSVPGCQDHTAYWCKIDAQGHGYYYTVSGPTPSCPSGQVWDNSFQQCVDDCVGQQKMVNGVCTCEKGMDGIRSGRPIAGSGTEPATSCYDGCLYEHGGVSVSVGGQWSSALGGRTGQTCNGIEPAGETSKKPGPAPTDPPVDNRTPEQKCAAAGKGFITTSSGTVCTAPGDSPEPVTTTKKGTTTTTNPDGSVTVTQTETKCVNGSCETKVVSSTTTQGGSTSTKTTTSTGTDAGSGSSSGSGSGTGGDGTGETDCDKHPNTVGCMEPGTPEDGEALPTQDVGVSSISVQSFATNAICPADIQLPKGAALSFKWPCDLATSLKPILLALAWLAAGMIVIGAFRDA